MLIRGYSYNKTYSNEQCKKNSDLSRSTRSFYTTRLSVIDNATKLVICQGSTKVIYASRLTRGYSHNEAHDNKQCNKNSDLLKYTESYLYNKAHNNGQCNKNGDLLKFTKSFHTTKLIAIDNATKIVIGQGLSFNKA